MSQKIYIIAQHALQSNTPGKLEWAIYPIQNHEKVRYLKKYTFLYSTPLNKVVLEWTIYPLKHIKIRFEHGLYSSSKLAQVPKIQKKKTIKKQLRGPYPWTCVPNLVQIGAYLGIELVPLLFLLRTHRLANIFAIGYFVVQKDWKAYNKFFRSIEGKHNGIFIP